MVTHSFFYFLWRQLLHELLFLLIWDRLFWFCRKSIWNYTLLVTNLPNTLYFERHYIGLIRWLKWCLSFLIEKHLDFSPLYKCQAKNYRSQNSHRIGANVDKFSGHSSVIFEFFRQDEDVVTEYLLLLIHNFVFGLTHHNQALDHPLLFDSRFCLTILQCPGRLIGPGIPDNLLHLQMDQLLWGPANGIPHFLLLFLGVTEDQTWQFFTFFF